jgi:pimeloyl-ACP methyl ester carboxylesterase
MTKSRRKLVALGLVLLVGFLLIWLATTDNDRVWPVRNTVQYHVLQAWWDLVGRPQTGPPGTLQGQVLDSRGQPVSGARVLVARWEGTTYSGWTGPSGRYRLEGVPAGRYRPVAGAPGFEDKVFAGWWGLRIRPGVEVTVDARLDRAAPRPVPPGQALTLGDPARRSCSRPVQATATRREVTFENGGQPNQLTYYYTPVTATTRSQLPILLAVYPGPADGWECASLPLAEAGYAVVGIGPAYSLDLEADIDELARLVQFGREGRLPGGDGSRIGLLGGSYSGLHVQRLLRRDQDFKAGVLLGPPTDLFDMRRRLEDGTYVPPYGLDRALIALGLPDRVPFRYWRYSGAYHVRADFPPLIVMHSRTDDIVPYQQSRLLAESLDRVDAVYETFFFEGADHYLLAEAGDEDAMEIYRRTLAFLAEHLR